MILVTGATGFVGRHLMARLREAGRQVRVLSRSGSSTPGAEVVRGDVRDLATVVPALRGCDAVVHLVGIIRERRGANFRRIHVDGTRTLIRACQEAGVGRLLHMSALGARPGARSRYHRTKWEAEEIVRASGLSATLFRPSVMFGVGNSFLPQVRRLVHDLPIVPIIGAGTGLIQPVWVEDVVSCFAQAMEDPETVGRTYELGGPEVLGFEQLVDMVAEGEGVRKPKVHLPPALLRLAANTIGRVIPGFPLTSDQLTMLLEDNVCDITEMRRTFGIEPACLGDHLAD